MRIQTAARAAMVLPTLVFLAAALVPAARVAAARLDSSEQAAAPRTRPYAATEERESCEAFYPMRRAWFGDLHAHTTLSQDASTQGTRKRPADAYRFARGERLGIQPYDAEGQARRFVRIDRPLDFAAVTDHAEMLGETEICKDPTQEGYESWVCWLYRGWPRAAFFVMNARSSMRGGRFGYCGEGGEICLQAARGPWQEIRDAAESAYDRSDQCEFTSFVAYEWTGARDLFNLHRNVIFRNDDVPDLPTSFYEAREGPDLWRALDRDCVSAGGRCDVLVIPHNSNLSGGLMFEDVQAYGEPHSREAAETQARYEPLLEVMQHKGDSECLLAPGASEDELCGFEQIPYDSFKGKFIPWLAAKPERAGFAREILKEGLAQEQAVGANPYRFGLIASTDTHLAAPGAVSEIDYPGHGGAGDPARDSLPVGLTDAIEFNPGGLAVAWAEENSRDSLFAAMRRREVYGTSGPRIQLRVFGGWGIDDNACARHDQVAHGYEKGVPMGGVLSASDASGAAPRFLVAALRDPGGVIGFGTPLQRLQIVKGWLDGGERAERVFEVAGDPANGARVDLSSCEPQGSGADSLCTVWTDPDFDPEERAFYYARAVENPTCRWSQRQCNAAGVRCDDPSTVPDGFAPCCEESHRPVVQERAWSSPIWYQPALERSSE